MAGFEWNVSSGEWVQAVGGQSHLERPWMGLHWSPTLDGQRGTSQQLGLANV